MMMRADITTEFLDLFKRGVDFYLEGRWQEAREELEQIEFENYNDFSTNVLLDVIEAENFEAPKDWKGY